MLKNIAFVAAGDNVKTAVLPICRVNSGPRPNGRIGLKPAAEVELVLMPRESETNLGGLPDKQIVDAEYIWTEQVDEWVR